MIPSGHFIYEGKEKGNFLVHALPQTKRLIPDAHKAIGVNSDTSQASEKRS